MIYFDNAATSWPKPPEVCRELLGIVSGEYGNPGRGSHRMALAASEKIYDCRCAVAEMFGSNHPEIVLIVGGIEAIVAQIVPGVADRSLRP